ncbi:MAG: nucleotide exchange factor GrpE [Mycoplasmataceae bacterium]|nr:nucleotide exchange factor GrpE [Mycoplasmataceae bacterium]
MNNMKTIKQNGLITLKYHIYDKTGDWITSGGPVKMIVGQDTIFKGLSNAIIGLDYTQTNHTFDFKIIDNKNISSFETVDFDLTILNYRDFDVTQVNNSIDASQLTNANKSELENTKKPNEAFQNTSTIHTFKDEKIISPTENIKKPNEAFQNTSTIHSKISDEDEDQTKISDEEKTFNNTKDQDLKMNQSQIDKNELNKSHKIDLNEQPINEEIIKENLFNENIHKTTELKPKMFGKKNREDKNKKVPVNSANNIELELKVMSLERKIIDLNLIEENLNKKIIDISENAEKQISDFKTSYKNRFEKEKEDIKNFQFQSLFEKILSPLNNLYMAVEFGVNKSDNPEIVGYVKGFELLVGQIFQVLDQFGVTVIAPKIGDEFNPELHNIIELVKSNELEQDKIIELINRGYKLKDRVIIPANVIVSKK